MCKVLKVPRRSYYKHISKTPSKRELENKEFEERILEIYEGSKKRYGAPKIHEILTQKDAKISLKRVQRLMQKLGIKSIIIRKYRPYSPKNKAEGRENVLKQDFSTTTLNKKCVTYITYIFTLRHSWCYLASVMDLCTKKIIGYSFSKTMETEMAIKAVSNALISQKPTEPVILHSDLGSQYTSTKFKEFVDQNKIIHSFSGKGNPYDNACIESFHAYLKKEAVNLVTYYDFDAARIAIFQYIESWYNRRRIHSSIGYLTPDAYENKLRESA